MSNSAQLISIDSIPVSGPTSGTPARTAPSGDIHPETIEESAERGAIQARTPAPGIDNYFPKTQPPDGTGHLRVVDFSKGPNKKIIIGLGVTGGVIAVFTVVIAVVIMKRRRRAKKLREMEEILEREEDLRRKERRMRRRIAAGEDVEMEELRNEPELPESSKQQSSGYKKVTSAKDLKRFKGNHYFV